MREVKCPHCGGVFDPTRSGERTRLVWDALADNFTIPAISRAIGLHTSLVRISINQLLAQGRVKISAEDRGSTARRYEQVLCKHNVDPEKCGFCHDELAAAGDKP